MQYTPLEDAAHSQNDENGADLEMNSKGKDAHYSRSLGRKLSATGLSEPLTGQGIEDNGMNSGYLNNDSTPSDDDPFYVFKEDLIRKLEILDEALSSYLDVINNTDTAVNTHEVKDVKKQLKRHIKHAESTLKDIQTINKLVEKQPDKFPNISEVELNNRTTFVSKSLTEITQVKQAMNSDNVKNKIIADERALAIRRAGGSNSNAQSQLEKENTAFLVNNTTQAQLMMKQQDETLDDLDDAVVRVTNMADGIHSEILSQNKLLDELDDDLQHAEENLGLVMGKLAKLLKTQNKCQLGTIMTLTLVVIVLFFLVLYS